MIQILSSDHMVSYDTFVDDLSNRIAEKIVATMQEPEVISQRMAYRKFGRSNVERWRKQGKVTPCKRPGRVEYRTADLRLLQRKRQDYFK